MSQQTNDARALIEISTAELTRLSKRSRIEQVLNDAGCLIGLSFGLVGSWAALLMLPLGQSNAASFFRITAAVAAFVLAPMLGKAFFGYLGNRRGSVYRMELARRFGQLPWQHQLERTQISLPADEIVILLRVAAKSARGEGHHCELRLTSDAGAVDSGTLVRIVYGEEFDFGCGIDPATCISVTERSLFDAEVKELQAAWRAAQTTKPRDLPLKDELLSQKTQVAMVDAGGTICDWSAHSADAILKKTGDTQWKEFLAMAFSLMSSA